MTSPAPTACHGEWGVNNEQSVIDLEPVYRHSTVLRATMKHLQGDGALLREFCRRAEKKSVRLTLKAIPHDAPLLIEGSEESAIAALRKLTYGMHP